MTRFPRLNHLRMKMLSWDFLKGAASSEAKGYYTVTYNRKREGWNLDVGAMQGLPQNAAPGSIELALWDFDAVGRCK